MGKIICKYFLWIKKFVHRADNAFTENDHFSTENFISLPPHEANKALKRRRIAFFVKKTVEKAVRKHNMLLKKICTNTSRNCGMRK